MDFPYVCQFPGADLNLILMILFMAYVRFLQISAFRRYSSLSMTLHELLSSHIFSRTLRLSMALKP